MKILITNTVALNGGDAAILEAIIDALRAQFGADARFVVFDSQPEIARRYFPHIDFRQLLYMRAGWSPHVARKVLGPINQQRFRVGAKLLARGLDRVAREILTADELRDLREYRSADLVVSTGGTYLVENYDIAHRLFDFEMTLLFGRPLVLYTQSLGPFRRPAHQRAIREVASKAALVLLRDELSKEHLHAIGVRGDHLRVVADAVFALDVDGGTADGHATHEQATGERAGQGPSVAISVRDWAHFKTVDPRAGMERYRQAVAAAVTRLVEERGARVTFVSTCQGVPEYWTNDALTAHAIVAQLSPQVREHVVVDEAFRTPHELVRLLGGFDMVLATRMHMAILALVAGTATLAVAYEFKTQELFERMGQGARVFDIETVSPGALADAALTTLDNRETIRAEQAEHVAKEREVALDAARQVAAVLARTAEKTV